MLCRQSRFIFWIWNYHKKLNHTQRNEIPISSLGKTYVSVFLPKILSVDKMAFRQASQNTSFNQIWHWFLVYKSMNKLFVIHFIITLNAHNNIVNSKQVINLFSSHSSELSILNKKVQKIFAKNIFGEIMFFLHV